MKVAMLAPPWLPIPPLGYGGIENVLAVLIPALMNLGVEVELFTVKESTIAATKKHWLYETGQYEYIHEPAYASMPIVVAQTLFAFNVIKRAGNFDIIHSHNGFVDPLGAVYTDNNLPPTLHTLHGPPFTTDDRLALHLPDNLPMWRELGSVVSENFYLSGISQSLMRTAPPELQRITVDPVHNGVDLMQFPFVSKKSNYFMTLARAHPDKGQGIAVQACVRLGYKLRLAGLVGNMRNPHQVMLELANPLSPYRSLIDFRYFSDQVFPYLDKNIRYVGDLSGGDKLACLGNAKALLFPIQWDEPFGIVAIEALACGTPVVAMARGALPEIIEHGVNGFLANSVEEFESYMQRVDEIDPAVCRRSVEEKFSADHMAKEYLKRYETILHKHTAKA
jgi:glycosyltransferase involved in cell wall biosynthesis